MSSTHRQEAKVLDYLLVFLSLVLLFVLVFSILYGVGYAWLTPIPNDASGVLWFFW